MGLPAAAMKAGGGLQLPLGITLRDEPSLSNFQTGANGALRAALEESVAGRGPVGVYLWGAPATGKTHLLEAICRATQAAGGGTALIPLKQYASFSPAMLEGLENLATVCLDDVQAVMGRPDWEERLFHLYNLAAETGARLLFSAALPPKALAAELEDLRSRLVAGLVFAVKPLDDLDRMHALSRRARERGFDLPDEVAGYLLRHTARDMHSLFAWLDRLDEASLRDKRRVTLPLVRELVAASLNP